MKFNRSSGILLHVSSLPSPDGIGDLGAEAYRWINYLQESGITLWQVLPLGPTGYGDSPYQCFSAFAGNPYLISPALLLQDGLLTRADLAKRPGFPVDRVDYGLAINWKTFLLDCAYERFRAMKTGALREAYDAFVKEEAWWLDDFAIFMAIKEVNNGIAWSEWDLPLRLKEEKAIQQIRNDLAETIIRHKLRQFLFFRQWRNLRAYAHEKGIQVIGDIPIFVAHDSADVWSHPELFFMDEERQPTVVAGVPPDYFAATGQLWGNPLYDWAYHKKTGYAWWIQRLKSTFSLYDIVRLDHFRGFAAYWEIPAGESTAINGHWKKGPYDDFFKVISKAFNGELPIIAEDLGEITDDVFELRDQFEFPGMKVMQFAFAGDSTDPFLPHNYSENCVAYTGTHDNDTSMGWYQHSSTEKERDFYRRYMARNGHDVTWDLIRAIWSSVADIVVAPMQDFLNLGTDARMNLPGTLGGNWQWRMQSHHLSDFLKQRIRETNDLYNRPDRRVSKYGVNKVGNDEDR